MNESVMTMRELDAFAAATHPSIKWLHSQKGTIYVKVPSNALATMKHPDPIAFNAHHLLAKTNFFRAPTVMNRKCGQIIGKLTQPVA